MVTVTMVIVIIVTVTVVTVSVTMVICKKANRNLFIGTLVAQYAGGYRVDSCGTLVSVIVLQCYCVTVLLCYTLRLQNWPYHRIS